MADSQTYSGGCHCCRVRYEVSTTFAPLIACNCSHCEAKGLILTFVPAEQFILRAGDGAQTEYLFNKHAIHHLFCSSCGVQSFARGKGRKGEDTVAINVRCLDGVDVAALKPAPFDGRSV
jgi:hypothetical protein